MCVSKCNVQLYIWQNVGEDSRIFEWDKILDPLIIHNEQKRRPYQAVNWWLKFHLQKKKKLTGYVKMEDCICTVIKIYLSKVPLKSKLIQSFLSLSLCVIASNTIVNLEQIYIFKIVTETNF